MPSTRRVRIFLNLGPDWAIGHDALQWIVYRRRKRQEAGYWNPVGYIDSNRDVLCRVLRENNAALDDGAWQQLMALPYSFKEWIKQGAVVRGGSSRDVPG
jgi:hypothetical protein